MGFVRTGAEIARIQQTLSHPRFVSGEMLSVDFLTTPVFVEEVLPPGLDPVEQPRLTAMVGRWQSNCVGDIHGGAVYVAARHGDIDGDYVLCMYMDRDQPIVFGRELFGEPKKQAHSRLHHRGDRFVGSVDRGGVRILDLDVDLTEDHDGLDVAGVTFNYKALPSSDGIGLEGDAALTIASFSNNFSVYRTGTGTVGFRSTVHDPLGDIEVVSVLGASYAEGDLIATCRTAAQIPADEFLPYALGRMDDWSRLNTETEAVPIVV